MSPSPAATAFAPGAGRAETLGLLCPPWWPVRGGQGGVLPWPESSLQKGPCSPRPRPQSPLARPRAISPPCHPPDVGVEGTHAPTTPPPNLAMLTHRSRLHPPPGAGPAVEAVRSSFFSTGMFLHAVHRVHASGCSPPNPPKPWGRAALAPPPPPHPGVLRPPPPSPPHRPHPTGQVLSLLEIKVHSLWCRGAAAAASCFVSGVRLSPIGDPQALCSPSSSPLPAPSVPAQSPQDPAGQG